MSPQYGTLLVVGSGPGVGRSVSKLFAANGFSQVILLSRDATRLASDAEHVQSAAPGTQVHTIPADMAKKQSVSDALAQVDRYTDKVPLQAVLYNAARVGESKFFEWTVEELEQDLAISVTSLYAVAAHTLPKLVSYSSSAAAGKPAFLVTSGLLCKEPFPNLFSLSACKAAQQNLVHSLYKEYGPKGVHCALVIIGGVVKDDAKLTTSSKIAEEFWGLFSQPSGKWELEVEMLDPEYDDMVRVRERSGETW